MSRILRGKKISSTWKLFDNQIREFFLIENKPDQSGQDPQVLLETINNRDATIAQQNDLIIDLTSKNEKFGEPVSKLEAIIQSLNKKINELEKKVNDLKNRLSENPDDSNSPPPFVLT